MADTRIRAEKATDVLKEDHKKVKELFAEYEDLEGGAMDRKLELFGQIQRELRIHAAIEEEIFYPGVEGVQKGKRDGVEIVAEAIEEHKVVKTLLDELGSLDPGIEAFDAKMKVLRENVEHHAEEEEDEMFPLFGQLERDDQEDVSENLSARKAELTQETPNE
jgi:hemerythrin superfamily protein